MSIRTGQELFSPATTRGSSSVFRIRRCKLGTGHSPSGTSPSSFGSELPRVAQEVRRVGGSGTCGFRRSLKSVRGRRENVRMLLSPFLNASLLLSGLPNKRLELAPPLVVELRL